jgi:hypothetical protein
MFGNEQEDLLFVPATFRRSDQKSISVVQQNEVLKFILAQSRTATRTKRLEIS